MTELFNSQLDNAGPCQSASQLSSTKQSPQKKCCLCKGQVKVAVQWLQCAHCNEGVHLPCLLKKFKDGGNDVPLKNKQEWLLEFIKSASLAYHCEACLNGPAPEVKDVSSSSISMNTVSNSKPSSKELESEPAVVLNDLRCEITSVSRRVDEMQRSIHNQLQQLMDASTGLLHASTDQTGNSHSVNSTTYASVLSKSVSETIKSAIVENIEYQKKADIDKKSIAVYGFPEDGKDYDDLHDLLAYLHCHGDIVQHMRIGRAAGQGKTNTGRPLKVILRLASDCDYVLSRVNLLRKNSYYDGVYISRWLSQEEMCKLKLLRQRCFDMNKSSTVDSKGRKPYVIISGKLMRRDADGKLAKVNERDVTLKEFSPDKLIVNSCAKNQLLPKNGQGGS